MVKYIFITGGVVSGLGKGITSASLGRLIKSRNYKVTMQKFDPYINFDAGTMNPIQHGECFVTDDGAETDLDLGHYERFIDENLNQNSNVTTGRIYSEVISKERRGEYEGNTVQVIPHITDQIISHFHKDDSEEITFCLIEIGGTVGDIESEPYIESIRQFRNSIPKEDSLLIHVALLPHLEATDELKTKPVQQSVKMLQERGLQADFIILRSDRKIDQEIKNKISLFCNVKPEHVFENLNLQTIYEVPLFLENLELCQRVLKFLNVEDRTPDLEDFKKQVNNIKKPTKDVTIAIVGKYTKLHDAYISVVESLVHAGAFLKTKVNIEWIDSQTLKETNLDNKFKDVNGIIVPGGFGNRGIDGMLLACKYARTNNIPFLGICLGLQISVIEFARNVLAYKNANSTEFNPNTDYPVICLLEEQIDNQIIGGTLRLGSYKAHLVEKSIVRGLYEEEFVSERHRHRYEVNPDYINDLESEGLKVSGYGVERKLVEFIENTKCDFYVATQAHPELKSRLNRPHPLFKGLINASLKQKRKLKKLQGDKNNTEEE